MDTNFKTSRCVRRDKYALQVSLSLPVRYYGNVLYNLPQA